MKEEINAIRAELGAISLALDNLEKLPKIMEARGPMELWIHFPDGVIKKNDHIFKCRHGVGEKMIVGGEEFEVTRDEIIGHVYLKGLWDE